MEKQEEWEWPEELLLEAKVKKIEQFINGKPYTVSRSNGRNEWVYEFHFPEEWIDKNDKWYSAWTVFWFIIRMSFRKLFRKERKAQEL